MKKKRIGVLGGTFDPPHLGHLQISKFSIKKLKLNYLIWAVTKKNPFKKKPMLTLKERILFSKKITKKIKKIKIKSYDSKIKSSETINLITYLIKKEQNAQFFFLMGSDNLTNLHRWKNWKQLSRLCQITVFPRKNYVSKSLNSKGFRTLKNRNLLVLKSKMFNISSSKIRKNYLKYKP
tara:strand:+ start:6609 stop:7145 length:537 start_codon:yes stop_codon:yes gene_type:complete